MKRIQEGQYDFPAKVMQLSSVERKLIKAVIDRALLQTQLSENLRNYCNISKQRKSASLEMETGTYEGTF